MCDGFEVDLGSVRRAAAQVREGADALGDGAALLALLAVDADALGRVPAAARFASAVANFASVHAEDQRHGSTWVDDAAENLTRTADLYQRADDDAASELREVAGR